MNRLNFWSRSSSKARTAEAKAEAEASEQKDDQDKKSKKHTTVEAKEDKTLEVVAPQEDVVKETANDRAGEQEQPKLEQVAPEEVTEAAPDEDDKNIVNDDHDKEEPLDSAGSTSVEDASSTAVPAAIATKDEQETSQAPGMPGGASTSAPHKDDDKTTSANEEKEEDTEAHSRGASKTASQIDEEKPDVQKEKADSKTESAETLENVPKKLDSETAPGSESAATTDQISSSDVKDEEIPEQVESTDDSGDADAVDPASIKLPLMKEEDEEFFNKMTTEDEPQQPPSMSRRPTQIGDDGKLHEPEDIPLPMSPGNEEGNPLEAKKDQAPATWRDRWNQWSFVPAAPSTSYFRRAPKEEKKVSSAMLYLPHQKILIHVQADDKAEKVTDEKTDNKTDEKTDDEVSKEKIEAAATETATDDKAEANAVAASSLTTSAEDTDANPKAAKAQQHRDLSHMLSNLKLSSLNNSVMGISHETQHLLESFTLTLKDVVNGAPTAYEDLDKLLNERGEQLDNLFGTMPPFVQTLVKNIPMKMYGAMAPSVAAAMSPEKSEGADLSAAEVGTDDEAEVTVDVGTASTDVKDKNKKKKRGLVPSVQSLVKEQGTVAAMLRSILNFLQARFPAFITGTNVLMSVAVFILLFVFWYCHKRGKQVRLSKQAANKIAAESSLNDLEKQVGDEKPRVEEVDDEAVDAPLPEVKDGELKEEASKETAEDAKESEIKQSDDTSSDKQTDTKPTSTQEASPNPTTEQQPADKKTKDINQTIAETFMGAKPSNGEAAAATGEKTKADEETQNKLAALQQKAVDDAKADDGKKAQGNDSDGEDDIDGAETVKIRDAALSAGDEYAAEEGVKGGMPTVTAAEEKKQEKKQDQPQSSKSQHTFDDLMKALEIHAKESGSSGDSKNDKNNDTTKKTAATEKKRKEEQEEVVDDPNEEMMSY